jgi:hypothetical protein
VGAQNLSCAHVSVLWLGVAGYRDTPRNILVGAYPLQEVRKCSKKEALCQRGGLCPEGRVSYTASMSAHKPTVLLIIDGFGVAPSDQGNAIKQAKMPRFQALVQSYPAMTVQASGAAVGYRGVRWEIPRWGISRSGRVACSIRAFRVSTSKSRRSVFTRTPRLFKRRKRQKTQEGPCI